MSTLYVGNKPVWSNPSDLGYFGIKLRKQVREEEIIERMVARRRAQTMRERHYDPPCHPLAGIGHESMFEVRRSFSRHGIPLNISVMSR
jgi:hypothetical protein